MIPYFFCYCDVALYDVSWYIGWTVSIEEGDTMVELNGGDFILDGLGEIELPPAFPVSNKTRYC